MTIQEEFMQLMSLIVSSNIIQKCQAPGENFVVFEQMTYDYAAGFLATMKILLENDDRNFRKTFTKNRIGAILLSAMQDIENVDSPEDE